MAQLEKRKATEFRRLRILLIDGSNYLHRGHWAIVGQSGVKKADLTSPEGFPTTGIKGMLNIILADISVLKPDMVVVCYDSKGAPNWRKLEYPEYKAGAARVAAKQKMKDSGENLYDQLRPIQRILRAMGVAQIGVLSEEADDIIGTLSVEFAELGHAVLISSNDKDFGSMVNKNVKIVEATTRVLLGINGVKQKYGVKPSRMVEFLMLQGDGVDNIPGVKGVAGKTAAKLLDTWGSIKGIVENVESLTPALRLNVKAAKKNFKWTRKLITLRTTIDHGLTLDKCKYKKPDFEKLEALCSELGLTQTHKQILSVLKTRESWSTK